MKQIKKYEMNQKIFSLAQILLLIISVLIFCLVMLMQAENGLDFVEMIQTDLTFNLLYVLSMFDAICFFELLYLNKKLKHNEQVEYCILNLGLICLAQLCLLNIFVGLLFIIFIYQFIKMNHLNLKHLFVQVINTHDIKVILLNAIFILLSIVMIDIMIIQRFT